MKLDNPTICKPILILLLATSHLCSAQSFTARSQPTGVGRSPSGSKWEKELPTKTIKLGNKLEFLAGLADHSKLLFSEDKKTYWLLDIKTGKKKKAFSQTEGASWVGAKGNTVLTRVGFGEQYIFRTFPDFNPSPLWNPPNGVKANGFAFGCRSNDFLCLTEDKHIHQFSLSSLETISKPFFHKDWRYINDSPFPLWAMQKKGIHLKECSSDLKIVAVGRYFYRKDVTGLKKLDQFLDSPPNYNRPTILSGNGNLLDHSLGLSKPFAHAPSSNIVVGFAQNESKKMWLTFADTSRNQSLFSVATSMPWKHERKREIQQLIYCKALNKLVVADSGNGVIHLIDADSDALAKVYPVQLSKQNLEVNSLEGFSYQPSFSRAEFIESYWVKNNTYWDIDRKSGRITPKDWYIKSARNFTSVTFIAKLKGGGSVSGFVSIKLKE